MGMTWKRVLGVAITVGLLAALAVASGANWVEALSGFSW